MQEALSLAYGQVTVTMTTSGHATSTSTPTLVQQPCFVRYPSSRINMVKCNASRAPGRAQQDGESCKFRVAQGLVSEASLHRKSPLAPAPLAFPRVSCLTTHSSAYTQAHGALLACASTARAAALERQVDSRPQIAPQPVRPASSAPRGALRRLPFLRGTTVARQHPALADPTWSLASECSKVATER